MLRSATDLFAQLELWEEAVTCLKVTDDVEKARALAEERIAVRPESGLLCLLAEMSQDPVYAQRAWDLSGGKYARAQRTLARMAFNRGDKDACITHFQMSLALNPLFEDAWFTMVHLNPKPFTFHFAFFRADAAMSPFPYLFLRFIPLFAFYSRWTCRAAA